ncbi:MAG TPA: hypothetical protein RMH99_12550 [Sandaracinaceae bacterium LLY-WYZ-13_1]|nr:hypothetical protein [Sandaracinaceae bacterium LLY-WYZ-13_1]
MTWQWVLVIAIEAAAIVFLVLKMWPRDRRPRKLQRPDVDVGSLTRKRDDGGDHSSSRRGSRSKTSGARSKSSRLPADR